VISRFSSIKEAEFDTLSTFLMRRLKTLKVYLVLISIQSLFLISQGSSGKIHAGRLIQKNSRRSAHLTLQFFLVRAASTMSLFSPQLKSIMHTRIIDRSEQLKFVVLLMPSPQ
jgi:hypothetical protein